LPIRSVYFRENNYNCCHQISFLQLKCTKFNFGWGSAPDPAGRANSASQTPSWILGGLTSKGTEGRGKDTERKGRGKKERGKKEKTKREKER